jgi:glutamyl-tRNA synthetase
LGCADSDSFVELVRHNVVLPGDAVVWRSVVGGELAPFGATEKEIIAGAGADFFSAALEALRSCDGDFKALTKLLKERTGRKGADLFMPLRLALTGRTHGPELAPMLKLMSSETARTRLRAARDLC